MQPRVVVLGAGYAGTGAIQSLEAEFQPAEIDLHWISRSDHHVVLHEAHRAIRDPDVEASISISVTDLKADGTDFTEAEVVGLDTDARLVELADGEAVEYDYLVVALGSDTAFYGIPGLVDHGHTMNSLEDAVEIHEAVAGATQEGSAGDPVEVVVGGAGLSGIQVAGEVAEYRDQVAEPIEITLVEALPQIYPAGGQALRARLRAELQRATIEVETDDPITELEADRIHFDDRPPMSYDVFIWTGGITGRSALDQVGVDTDHGRLYADDTFQTSDPRIFSLGDAAVVAQDGQEAPPTAQAAWDAATLLGTNVRGAMADEELEEWEYESKGTLISIGRTSLAADIPGIPIEVFDSFPATLLKKGAAARWIASITSWPRALKAWNDL
jgi:NADH dehydrogenase